MNARLWATAAVVAAALLTGCQGPDTGSDEATPVTLKPVGSTARYTVELSAQAAQRLGIRTVAVARATGAPSARLAIPYSGVIYDSDGSAWTYVQTQPDTYARHRVQVARVVGPSAYLRSGPKPGTEVVVVGAPELLGAEYQISGEE